jgi:hypothetical protein
MAHRPHDAWKGRTMRISRKWMVSIAVLAVLLLATPGLGYARGGGHSFGGHGFGAHGFRGHGFGKHGFGPHRFGTDEFGRHKFGTDEFRRHEFGGPGFSTDGFGANRLRSFPEDFHDQ